tara:strand:- start:566 stop:700 length:135 start_codon:yes stop_codon:yes gene_type:complete
VHVVINLGAITNNRDYGGEKQVVVTKNEILILKRNETAKESIIE